MRIKLKDYEFKMLIIFLASSLLLIGRKFTKYLSTSPDHSKTTTGLRRRITALETELKTESHLVRYVQIVNPEIFYSLMPENTQNYRFLPPDDDKINQIKNATLLHEKLDEEVKFLEEKLLKSRRLVHRVCA